MPYEITTRTNTVYTVDGKDFDNRKNAKAHLLFVEMWDRLNQHGSMSVFEAMEATPQLVGDELQQFIKDKAAIYAPSVLITGANFNNDKAWTEGRALGLSVYNWGDMETTIDTLIKSGRLINAIKFMRSCFTEQPDLMESKNWVVARRDELRVQGFICQ